jgi:hypothetical protein
MRKDVNACLNNHTEWINGLERKIVTLKEDVGYDHKRNEHNISDLWVRLMAMEEYLGLELTQQPENIYKKKAK